jgi:hypothetical protein
MLQVDTGAALKIQRDFSPKRSNPNKHIIEDTFLSTAKQYLKLDRCLVVTGPQYKNHINKLISSGANEIFVSEISTKVFLENIVEEASLCSYYMNDGRVSLLNADIKDVMISDCNYIDLDLMKTIKSVLPIVKKHIKHQNETVDGVKAFTFTFSNRNCKTRKELLNRFHKEMFGAKINISEGYYNVPEGTVTGRNPSKYCHDIIPFMHTPGTLIDAKIFHYADSGPMASVMYIYY